MLLVSQWCEYQENIDYSTFGNYRKYRRSVVLYYEINFSLGFINRQFENYAADVLDRYYTDNENKTIEFLKEESILYYEQQPIVVIDDLCSKILVSTKSMQAYMNRIWYGDQFHKEKNFHLGNPGNRRTNVK